MSKNITNTERIANELLLEKYKPLMVVKLSHKATNNLQGKLKEFAFNISKKTKYEVLIFPDEVTTEVKIVSVCNTEKIELKDLQNEIYSKGKEKLKNIPFTPIKDKVKQKSKTGK
tara:strand:- start:617 stop:961 length:345 start_codon:yes stop_codon:yes gene_type:complete